MKNGKIDKAIIITKSNIFEDKSAQEARKISLVDRFL